MVSQQAVQAILGIQDKVQLAPEEMADKLNLTFYPHTDAASEIVQDFAQQLQSCFERLKVNIVPLEDAMDVFPLRKRAKRFFKYSLGNLLYLLKKVTGAPQTSFWIDFSIMKRLCAKRRYKKGICIVCIGEQNTENLAMQSISNFKDNSVITILDFPKGITTESSFKEHFDTAMALFAQHMSNIIIAANNDQWMIYNFNMSHPIYSRHESVEEFDKHILHALVPKIVAPISPHVFRDFQLSEERFDPSEEPYLELVRELKDGARLFGETDLFPTGKQIDDLPFRNNFHRLIGKLHLDGRSGMSFGFFAHQMATEISSPVTKEAFCQGERTKAFSDSDFFFDENRKLYILIETIDLGALVLKVPDVWVLSLRSGSNKTDFDPEQDLLKLGLIDGQMWMEFPKSATINQSYRPSFDTKVILAHAVGNAIIAALLKTVEPNHKFVERLSQHGMALSHWHGYFNRSQLPEGVLVYGDENPHVSCSSPQSAIYALAGKLDMFSRSIGTEALSRFEGDIHIEPHHGSNVSAPSLVALAEYILKNPEATALGNKYLHA